MNPAATLDVFESEQAALTAADYLFYNRGIAAVTMGEIRDRSGVSLRRLYSLYPSKSDLISAWLRHRHVTWMTGFTDHVDGRQRAGDDPIDAVFSALGAWMTETGFRGCAFINTHAETSGLAEDHREIIRSHKEALAAYLEDMIPEGRAVAVIIDGAIVQAAIFDSAEPIEHARRAAVAIDSIGTRP